MRNMIMALVLANLLLLAWEQWIAPGEVADPTRFADGVTDEFGPQLVLYSAARADTLPASSGLTPVADLRQCERVGPFDSPEPAAAIAQQLGRRGLIVDLLYETGDIWVGHWVQVIDLESGAAARQAVERLANAGLKDAYIVRTDPTVDISLGVFRGEAGADRVENLARGAGLEPVRHDRYRTGTQHWVSVELRRNQTLELTDLRLPTAQILRAETVACRPTADVLADAATESPESVAESGAGVADGAEPAGQ
ncbi:MAG: SPOR domain-containing protein [Gammaproteobacteria bacterium]